MTTLLQDIRYAYRMLLRSPGFTAVALLCLALGIGATTAIYSVVNAVVLRPLAYSEPERLMRIYSEFPTFPNGGLRKFWISGPEFVEIRRDLKSFASIEAWQVGGANLAGSTEPIRVTTAFISGGMLPMLGVAPILGRSISPEDDRPGASLTAVLSHSLWQRAFGGESGIIGKEVKFNGRGCTVIGVMPPGFQFPPGETDPPELWVPLQVDPANPGNRGGHSYYALGRVQPNTPLTQAQAEMTQYANQVSAGGSAQVHRFHPKNHTLIGSSLHEEVIGNVRPAMLMMLGAVGFVLLIACVNVANLLLARAEARQKEIAIRTAMGAGTAGLVRQFVAEGMLLSLLGAAGGLLLAYGAIKLLLATSPGNIPRVQEIGLDRNVLLFALAVSIGTGLFFGLAPMVQVLARTVNDVLKAASGRNTATVEANRLRRAMVIGELALALMLLIGTGLMVRAFWKLQQVQVGLNPSHLVTMRLALPRATYPNGQAAAAFWTTLQDRLGTVPEIVSASVMSGLPPNRPVNANDTQIENFVPKEGGPIQSTDYYQTVGKRYFETMQIPLLEGRLFDDRDGAEAPPAVIINQSMAKTFWPGESAIGRRIRPSFQDPWRTIVGVVADVKNSGIDKPTGTELYLPYRQLQNQTILTAYIVARTAGDPLSVVGAIRGELARLDASLPVAQVRTMEDVISRAQARPRFLTMLLTLFSAVALSLAAIGIYGVISYSVEQRTNEFGVRMALGAETTDVLRLVLRQGLTMGLIGVGLGAAGALALTRFLQSIMSGVDRFDPITFTVMAILLVAVTLAACLIPARRATKVDPVIALRYE